MVDCTSDKPHEQLLVVSLPPKVPSGNVGWYEIQVVISFKLTELKCVICFLNIVWNLIIFNINNHVNQLDCKIS